MWPDRVSNPGPLTYESGALPTTLRGPAARKVPGRVAQSVGHLTRKSGVLGSIPGLATYVRKSVVRLTDRADMTLDVYRGYTQQQKLMVFCLSFFSMRVILTGKKLLRSEQIIP